VVVWMRGSGKFALVLPSWLSVKKQASRG